MKSNHCSIVLHPILGLKSLIELKVKECSHCGYNFLIGDLVIEVYFNSDVYYYHDRCWTNIIKVRYNIA